jgi:hypothetical protein
MEKILFPSADAVAALVMALPGEARSRLVAEATDGGYVVEVPDDLETAVVAIDLDAAMLARLRVIATAAIDGHVEATARARGYNSAASCASYVMSTNAGWAAEAEAFVAWRDGVWSAAFALFAAVEAGTEAVPTVDALIAGLPAIAWPESVG